MRNDTWTHKLARYVARPLIGTGITPNHITTLRLLTGLASCVILALGTGLVHRALFWGGTLWLVSAFLDRVDGELARIGNMMSPGGHRYDYLVDNGINSLFFLAIGIGLRHATLWGHSLGPWPIILGIVSAVALLLCNWMSEIYEAHLPDNRRIYPGAWGFHPDDALYLLGPLAWLGWLLPVLVGATIGTSVMAVVIAFQLRQVLRPVPAITR